MVEEPSSPTPGATVGPAKRAGDAGRDVDHDSGTPGHELPRSPLLIPRGHAVGASGLPLATVPAADPSEPDEVERLESLLAARAGELARERAEHARLRALLCDSLERFGSLPPAVPPAVSAANISAASISAANMEPAALVALRAEHARVLERALDAEAGRADAAFRLDEALGHLLTARGRTTVGVPAPNLPDVPSAVLDEAAQVNQARLTGTVRGLTAALSESEEARDIANARRLLVEHDLEDARERITALSRNLVEAREHAELGDVQSRSLAARLEGSVDARAAATVRGEALGARARLDEAERALAGLDQDLDASHADADELRQALGQARAELSALRSESAAMQERISELDRAVARETENSREAGALATRQHAERLVLHDELARARAELLSLRASLDELRSGQTRVREEADAERSSARQAAADRHARAERMADALREVRALLGELPAALMRALSPDPLASRDPTLPGTVRAFEGATMTGGEGVDEALRTLEARVTEATRVLRELQDAPGAFSVRAEVDRLLRLLELG